VTEAAEGTGAANDATVLTTTSTEELRAELARRGEIPLTDQQQRERYADEAEAAVEVIEAKLAGMKETLATAKAEAKRLRAEANEGAKG
jgi:ribosome maturation protein Sdo1